MFDLFQSSFYIGTVDSGGKSEIPTPSVLQRNYRFAGVPDRARRCPSVASHAEPVPTRLALLIGGVDISGSGGGVISATQDEADLEQTVAAFEQAVTMLNAEENLPRT